MVKKLKKNTSGYTADSITVLEGLDPVKKRPGMYIGSTSSSGLHHLIWEVVDNSIDEAMAGFANAIGVVLTADGMVQVTDNGRGIPVGIHKVTGVSALETVLTKLHAGGKFGDGGYKVSGGLHGVGVSVVNALSIYLKAEVHRDGKIYQQEYKQGKPRAKVKPVGKSNKNGTVITFKPDPEIFTELEFSWGKVLDRLRQQAYLTKGVTITATDLRPDHSKKTFKFHFEGGIKSYVKSLNRNQSVKNETIFYVEKEVNDSKVEVALQYNDEYNESVMAFANNIHNQEGGTHLVGFRTALTRTLNSYARNQKLLKEKDENLTGDDVREGLTAIVSVKLTDPQFEGQTKGKLGNAEMKTYVEQVFGDAFSNFLEENPKQAEAITGKCILSSQARIAARTARATILRKGALEGMTLPGKLADCSSRKPEESELYIVEGDSAGGCFDGDTKIAMLSGRNLSFKELVSENRMGKKNYCYTINHDGGIGVGEIINPRLTKKSTNVIKVVLDNDDEIVCTPDHKFMLRDGAYKMAKDLTAADSLMPLYRQHSRLGKRITIEGYELVFDPKDNRWIFTHLIAGNYKNAERAEGHVHHIDFNKLNNNPDNLVRLDKEEHLNIHRQFAKMTLHRSDVKEKVRRIRQTPEFRDKIRKIMNRPKMKKLLSARAKNQWKDEGYKKFMTEKFLEFYAKNTEYREKNNRLLDKNQKEYWSEAKHRQKQAERVKNFFKDHPERKKLLSETAKKQWQNPDLVNWRKDKTKKQWTPEFRQKRKAAYDQTYLNKALAALYAVYKSDKKIDKIAYDRLRNETNDKSLIRYETICQRFFDGDEKKLKTAVMHHNHRIKKIVPLVKKIDVYDIEVPGTHNFALASGVFVHNSAKQGRDRKFQAILPLRGKILNVERARLDKMLANNEIKNLVIALGTNIDDQFDLEKLRYHRVIIMTDADVDGSHIRTLLLTLFFRHFTPLVDNGNLYVAQPPLYQIKKGTASRYAYSDAEKDRIVKELGGGQVEVIEEQASEENDESASSFAEAPASPAGGSEDKKKAKAPVRLIIQRYKGLGEMNPSQLWETTMDPEKRIMKQITVEDASQANETFEMLMGDDVASRKNFIQTHAKKVENLDI